MFFSWRKVDRAMTWCILAIVISRDKRSMYLKVILWSLNVIFLTESWSSHDMMHKSHCNIMRQTLHVFESDSVITQCYFSDRKVIVRPHNNKMLLKMWLDENLRHNRDCENTQHTTMVEKPKVGLLSTRCMMKKGLSEHLFHELFVTTLLPKRFFLWKLLSHQYKGDQGWWHYVETNGLVPVK